MPLDIAIIAKPKGPMPMPKAFGQSPSASTNQGAAAKVSPIASGDNTDDETAEAQGTITIKPEAVGYRVPEEKCSACEYRADDQSCKILKISVEDAASCNAFEEKEADAGAMPDVLAGYGNKGY